MHSVTIFWIANVVFLANAAIIVQAEDFKVAAAVLEKAAEFYKNGEEVAAAELTLKAVKIYEKLGSA